MIIIHIAYITCLVTNDALHAYNVIGIYKIHYRAGNISYFAEQPILWLTGTLMGEVLLAPVAFNGTSNTVDGYDGYGRGRARNI